MRVGAQTHVGRIRSVNEDAYHVSPSLLVVADGMGGHAAGEVASGIAVRTLATWPAWVNPVRDLRASIAHANDLIVTRAASDPNQAGMGTTITAMYILQGQAHFAHVGDSRLYLLRKGVLTRLTRDHSVVGELQRIGGLTESEARVHPQRNVLTRALGVPGALNIDQGVIDLALGDRFILCSDGLTCVLLDQEINKVLAGQPDPHLAAQELVVAANSLGGPDNVTVIVADIVEEDIP